MAKKKTLTIRTHRMSNSNTLYSVHCTCHEISNFVLLFEAIASKSYSHVCSIHSTLINSQTHTRTAISILSIDYLLLFFVALLSTSFFAVSLEQKERERKKIKIRTSIFLILFENCRFIEHSTKGHQDTNQDLVE